MCRKAGLTLARDAEKYAAALFAERYNKRSANYANARDARNFFEHALVNQANRVAFIQNITNEQLSHIAYDDVVKVKM
jgi:hypothetical protein